RHISDDRGLRTQAPNCEHLSREPVDSLVDPIRMCSIVLSTPPNGGIMEATAQMSSNPYPAASRASDMAPRTIRKVRNRLIPLLFLLYIVAFLDRINIAFAALTMNADLGITSTQFGLLTGIFFWGYSLFEIPSNLLLHKIGARVW